MRIIVLFTVIIAGTGLASAAPREAIELSAGHQHACAVTTTGDVVCWGSHAWDRIVPPTVMPGITDAIGVAAGRDYSCAVTKPGAVWCWGHRDPLKPTRLAGIDDATQLATSSSHACALRRGGTVACWGEGRNGQLGDRAAKDSPTPVAVRDVKDAVQIAVGGDLSCARLASRRVVCWGNDNGDSSGTRIQLTPVAIQNLDDAIDLAAGKYQVCAIRGSGRVACWGLSALGADHRREIAAVAAVDTPIHNATDVSTSGQRTCAVHDGGAVSCWGEGLLGDGNVSARGSSPVRVTGISDAVQVAVASTFACARRTGGRITCWGENRAGQLGIATPVSRDVPTQVKGVAGATHVAVGDEAACATTKTGVMCWGKGATTPWRVDDTAKAKSIVAGPSTFCIRRKDDSSACWGDNSRGQLSAARNVGPDDLVEVFPDTLQLTTTGLFTCAAMQGDALMCNGDAPREGDALTDIREVAGGERFLCARRSNGDVTCWGPAFYRRHAPVRMGCVTHEDPPDTTPRNIAAFAAARQVAANGSRVCALRKNGEVACLYAHDQLRDVAKPTITNVGSAAVQLAIGSSERRCVRNRDGTVACWAREDAPKRVPKLTDVVDVSVGSQTTCAVHQTGRVSCWGYNGRGEVGDGTTGDRFTPGADVTLP